MAEILNVTSMATKAVQDGLNWPSKVNWYDRYLTSNQSGGMMVEISPLAQDFIKIAAQPGKKVLEIGPAYGNVCLEALKQGALDYTVVESSEEHLKILALKAVQEFSAEKAQALTLIRGNFPDQSVIEKLMPGKYDAIFAQGVLILLTEDQVKRSFQIFHKLLNRGGKIMISSLSPHLYYLKDDFLKKLEEEMAHFLQKVENGISATENKNNETSPQLVEKLPGSGYKYREVVDDEKLAKRGYKWEDWNLSDSVPIFFFHHKIISYLLKLNGFEEESLFYQARNDCLNTDGRENLIVVARKDEEI